MMILNDQINLKKRRKDAYTETIHTSFFLTYQSQQSMLFSIDPHLVSSWL